MGHSGLLGEDGREGRRESFPARHHATHQGTLLQAHAHHGPRSCRVNGAGRDLWSRAGFFNIPHARRSHCAGEQHTLRSRRKCVERQHQSRARRGQQDQGGRDVGQLSQRVRRGGRIRWLP